MRRTYESVSHIDEVDEQFRLRSAGGAQAVDEMISNLRVQVEYAEMMRHMGRSVLGNQFAIQSSAEQYGQRLPMLRQQLMRAIMLRDEMFNRLAA